MEKHLYTKISETEKNNIIRSIHRANVESVPYWKQDLPFKLIKLNELNWENWILTDTV